MSAIILLVLPVALAAATAVLAPHYYSRMVGAGLGRLLIAACVVLYTLAVLSMRWIVRRIEAGRLDARVAPLVMLLPLVVFVFPVVWVILVGPAIVVLAGS